MKELRPVPKTIAVTGHDPVAVTLLARELATVLKYPLIAGDDISPPFSSFGIKFPEDVYEFVAFTAACRVASTQLTSVRISVIIKAVVTRALPFHMIKETIEEVACGRARLIVACDVRRECEQLRLSIQAGKKTTELKLTLRNQTVDVKDFLRFIEDSASQGQIEEDAPKVRSNNDHLHKLILSTGPSLYCKRCSEPICVTHYQCRLCEAFPLHNECATSPISAVDGTCPCYLLENPPIYDFPHALRNKCNNCAEFQDDCCDCLLETVLKNGFLPMILCHRLHKEHPLSFTIMPHSVNYGYPCRACGEHGKSVSYKCCYDDCNFDLHIKCSLPPQPLKLKTDRHSSSNCKCDPGKHHYGICKRNIEPNR